jgi:DNA-binding MarR family transcriptional regulator
MTDQRAQNSGWTVLTNHGRVLSLVAADPDVRVRDIAAILGITERTVLRVIADLEQSGHLAHERVGTRNRYVIPDTSGPRAAADLDPDVLTALVTEANT